MLKIRTESSLIGETKRAPTFSEWLWRDGDWFHNGIRLPFTMLSWMYGALCRFRIFLYEAGILPKKRVDCPVVSIGNITTGGTGKTPLTIYLAEKWQERGKTVGIVSRGYRRETKTSVVLVSDGSKLLESARSVGDEPRLMAERLKGVPIIVAADRYEGCRWLISRFHVDLILLDDGFQHIRLDRDLNLLLIDVTNPFGNGRLLPRGSLREPVSEIRRADCVIFTRTDREEDMADLSNLIKRFERPFLKSRFQASELIDFKSGLVHPLSDLKGQLILAVCGIGNPKAFLKQLSVLGAKIQDAIIFQDHHDYKPSDIHTIGERAEAIHIARIVTTEKDAVKMKGLPGINLDIWILRIDMVFLEALQHQEDILFSK